MSPDTLVREFANFLSSSWNSASISLSSDESYDDLLADWLQANWEILVEAPLFPGGAGFLEPYGDGAECNGDSSRVYNVAAVPTHRVLCQAMRDVRDLGSGAPVSPGTLAFWGFV